MTANNHEDLVSQQFSPQAAAYVASAVHAQGADLAQLVDLVRGQDAAQVLDLGCGGGHVSFNVAPHVADVTAYDLSSDMLTAVRAEAARRGLDNITTRQGPAEALPFPAQHFDFVLSRYSAHHWRDLPQALSEIRRVLKPGGTLVFADVVAPESPLLDTFLQTVEMLRDPSHVRDYRISEWLALAAAAGFGAGEVTPRRLHLEFTTWVARINTPPAHVQAIRSLQAMISQSVLAHFDIADDGSFTVDTASLQWILPAKD